VANGHRELEVPLPPSTNAWGPAFSRDDKLIFFMATSDDSKVGSLHVWSADSGQLRATLQKAPGVDHAFNLFDQGGRKLVYIDPGRVAEIYDLESGRVVRRIAGDFNVAASVVMANV